MAIDPSTIQWDEPTPQQQAGVSASAGGIDPASIQWDQPAPPAARTQQPNFDNLIQSASTKHGVDPRLVRAVIQAESSFNPKARSPAGARGLMQLMPATAADLGVTDPDDPVQNVDGGVRYLRQLLDRYGGNYERALTAYNWGMGNLEKEGFDKRPKETRDYTAKILSNIGDRDVPIPGAVQDEAVRAPEQQPSMGSDSSVANAVARGAAGFRRGFMDDVSNKGSQLVAALIPDELERTLSYEGLTNEERLQREEAEYQRQRSDLGGEGVDLGRLGGAIVTPPNMALGAAGAPAWMAKLSQKGRAVVNAMVRGGIGAGMQPVDTSKGDTVLGTTAQQVGLGAALGPVAEGVGRLATAGVGRAIGAARGKLTPEAEEALKRARQAGVRLSAGDIAPENKMLTGVEGALENTRIPGLSLSPFRKEQQLAAQKEAKKLVDEEFATLQKMSYMGIDRLRTLAGSNGLRSKEAGKILQMIDNAGTDERAIMKASGNLGWLQKKLSADKLYNEVDVLAADAHVPPTSSLKALDEALEAMQGSATRRGEVDVDPSSLALIRKWRTQLEDGGVTMDEDPVEAAVRRFEGTPDDAAVVPNTYARMRRFRSDVLKRVDAATTNETTDSSKLFLKNIATAIEKDMDDFAKNTPGLKEANARAADFYERHVVPYQKGKLGAALTAGDPDQIYGAFVRAQAEGRGDYAAQKLWTALDNKGRQAVRYGIVRQAFDNAMDQGRFSPAKFKNAIESTEYAQYFRGDKQRVDGIINLMGLLRSASPEHLERYAPMLGGQLGLGSVGLGAVAIGAGNMAMGLGSAGLLRWLMTSDAGKRALFSTNALSKNGTNAQVGRFLDDLARQYNTAAAAATGAEVGQQGRVLP